MARSIQKVNTEVVTDISVFDSSNTAVTGLVDGNFTKRLTKDGVVSAVTVTVTEINAGSAPGEYKVAFTPNAVGEWRLHIIHATHQPRGWQETWDVTTEGPDTWGAALETGFTASRILRTTAAAAAGKASGGPDSPVFRNLADTQDQITGTADSNGNRTAASYGA